VFVSGGLSFLSVNEYLIDGLIDCLDLYLFVNFEFFVSAQIPDTSLSLLFNTAANKTTHLYKGQ